MSETAYLKQGTPFLYDPRQETLEDKRGAVVGRFEPAGGLMVAVALSSFEQLVEALELFAERGVTLSDLQCHRGLVEVNDCARCKRVIAARRALQTAGRWWR